MASNLNKMESAKKNSVVDKKLEEQIDKVRG